MIERALRTVLEDAATHYPVVTVTGPRQSGKTTLCRQCFPELTYRSLERPDVRRFAKEDPRGFLASVDDGAILDEVQHVPELLSYLQGMVDEDDRPGRFVLTGSEHLGLSDAVAQSLAGRTGVLHLFPPDLGELRRFEPGPESLFSLLWQGSYPRIWDRRIPAQRWLADYTATYVERDVRRIASIGDLEAFRNFLHLCAGRTGQEVNLSKLGADAGVSHNTARAWLSVLEASFVILRIPAFHANVRKQIIKAPKMQFVDTGLACYLLGIRTPDELTLHPLRGAIFESWVVSEIYKRIVHGGRAPRLFHYRESRGVEVDLVVDEGDTLWGVEAKSGATVSGDMLKNVRGFVERVGTEERPVRPIVIYGGDEEQRRSDGVHVMPWSTSDQVDLA